MKYLCLLLGVLAFAAPGCRSEEKKTTPEPGGKDAPFVDPDAKRSGDPPGLAKGKSLFTQKSYTASLREFDEYIKLHPEDARGYYYRAVSLQALGRNDEAVAALEKAVEREPDFPEKHNNLAGMFIVGENYEAGIRVLEAAVRKFPRETSLWYNLGLVRLKREDYGAAAGALEKAASLGGGAKLYLTVGVAYLKMGRPKEALKRFLKVLEGGSANAPAEEGAAKSLLALNRPKEALSHAKKAVELSPGNPSRTYLLGSVFLALRRFNEAAEAFGRASVRANKNPRVFLRWAEALKSSGVHEKALEQISKAEALAGDADQMMRGEILLFKGEILVSLKRCKKAVKVLSKAKELLTHNGDLLKRVDEARKSCSRR